MAILGDFNEQLQGGVQNRTGKWVGGLESKNVEKIMQILRLHNLSTANTYFKLGTAKKYMRFYMQRQSKVAPAKGMAMLKMTSASILQGAI